MKCTMGKTIPWYDPSVWVYEPIDKCALDSIGNSLNSPFAQNQIISISIYNWFAHDTAGRNVTIFEWTCPLAYSMQTNYACYILTRWVELKKISKYDVKYLYNFSSIFSLLFIITNVLFVTHICMFIIPFVPILPLTIAKIKCHTSVGQFVCLTMFLLTKC